MYKIIGADGKEYGPIAADQVRQWITEGRANGQTVAQAEGTNEWKPLKLIPEFKDALSSAPAVMTVPPLPSGPPVDIPNYLVQAILVTLCCCVPFGIVAIVYASQVSSKLAKGDYAGAEEASSHAKKWCKIGFGCGLAVSLLWMAVQGVMLFGH